MRPSFHSFRLFRLLRCVHSVLTVGLLCGVLCGVSLPARAETPQDYVTAFGATQCAQIKITITDGATVTVYEALAQSGTSDTVAAWQCSKTVYTTVGGTVTKIRKWADGNLRFDNLPGPAGAGLAALTYQ